MKGPGAWHCPTSLSLFISSSDLPQHKEYCAVARRTISNFQSIYSKSRNFFLGLSSKVKKHDLDSTNSSRNAVHAPRSFISLTNGSAAPVDKCDCHQYFQTMVARPTLLGMLSKLRQGKHFLLKGFSRIRTKFITLQCLHVVHPPGRLLGSNRNAAQAPNYTIPVHFAPAVSKNTFFNLESSLAPPTPWEGNAKRSFRTCPQSWTVPPEWKAWNNLRQGKALFIKGFSRPGQKMITH